MGISRRGSLTSTANRAIIIKLVQEAVASGARQKLACEVIGLSERTLQRWCKEGAPADDQRPLAKRPAPANKLTDEERKAILDVVNQPEFQSLPPSQIVPILADQGTYLASESTMYRVMHEAKEQHHRGRSKAPSSKPISTHCATAPNRVWSWDETAKHASHLVRRAVISQKITRQEEPLVLHSDNGSPMKGASMLETLYQLGITPSRSRPRVSNDNPYSESVFRTCK